MIKKLKNLAKKELVFSAFFALFFVLAFFLWRYFYLENLDSNPTFEKDIFRTHFRDNLAPFYGINTGFLINFKTVFLNAFLIFGIYVLLQKITRFSLWTNLIFCLGLVFLMAQKESNERFLGEVSHFETFSEDLNHFKNPKEVFTTYNAEQKNLGIHNGHYPPTLLFLLKSMDIHVLKIIHYLLLIPIFFLLFKIQKILEFKSKNYFILAFIPAFLIFPSLDFVLFPSLFFVASFYLLLSKIRFYEYYLGVVCGIWLLFNFNIFIALVFFFFFLLLNKNYTFKEVLLLILKAFLPLILIQILAYYLLNLNIITCFFEGLHQNHVKVNGFSFDNLSRYFLRSSGNLLAFALGIGPLFLLVIYSLFYGENKSLSWVLILSLVFLSFGGLYFLETDRVWYIFIFPVLFIVNPLLQKMNNISHYLFLGFSAMYLICYELLLAQ